MPVLLRSREVPLQVVLAAVVPALAGAIAGWLLGVNEAAYRIWSIIALAGGFFAGLEHRGAGEGAIRGVIGGGLFGATLLLVHHAIGDEPKADLVDPEVALIAITAAIGTVAGALGGARRAKREGKMAEAQEQEEETGPEAESQTEQQQSAREAARKGKEQREEKKEAAFSLGRLHWYEYLGFLAAFILAASLFLLPWFSTSCKSDAAARIANAKGGAGCNPNSVFNGVRGNFTGTE